MKGLWQRFLAWVCARAVGTPTSVRVPTRGVPVGLDRVRHLRYSLATLEDIRAEFGDGALTGELTGHKLARVLWYGLRDEDPSLTPESVAALVDLEHLTEVTAALVQALGSKRGAERVAVDAEGAVPRPTPAPPEESPEAP
jgi:hypothetical protein